MKKNIKLKSKQAIICVDDEKSILAALEQQISRQFVDDYILEFAQSGEEAIEILNQLNEEDSTVSFVITDHMMPGIKGSELIEIIHEKYPETKCILLSGYADSEQLKILSHQNLLASLSKPWNNEQLMHILNSQN